MRTYIYIEKDRIAYLKVRKGGGQATAKEMGSERLKVGEAWEELRDFVRRHGLGKGRAVLVLGDSQVISERLCLPKASRRILRQMAAREMERRREEEGGLTVQLTEDPLAEEKWNGEENPEEEGVRRLVWAADEGRLKEGIEILREEGISCESVLAAPDCLCLLASGGSQEYVLTAGLFENEIRLYLGRKGRCLKRRSSPFRAGVLFREQMDELVFEELAEQTQAILEGERAVIRLLPGGFPDGLRAAGALSSLTGLTCQVEERLAELARWEEETTAGPETVLLQAAALAWEDRRSMRPVNFFAGMKERRGRLADIKAMVPVWLALAVLAASFAYRERLDWETKRIEEQADLLEYSLNQQKLQEGEGLRPQGPGEEDFKRLREALLPGMEMAGFSFDGEVGRLTVHLRMEDRAQGPEYAGRLREQNPGLVAEYAGWEREETEGREGYRMTIHIDLGGEP